MFLRWLISAELFFAIHILIHQHIFYGYAIVQGDCVIVLLRYVRNLRRDEKERSAVQDDPGTSRRKVRTVVKDNKSTASVGLLCNTSPSLCTCHWAH